MFWRGAPLPALFMPAFIHACLARHGWGATQSLLRLGTPACVSLASTAPGETLSGVFAGSIYCVESSRHATTYIKYPSLPLSFLSPAAVEPLPRGGIPAGRRMWKSAVTSRSTLYFMSVEARDLRSIPPENNHRADITHHSSFFALVSILLHRHWKGNVVSVMNICKSSLCMRALGCMSA